jgi:hypothetical protein
MTPACRRHVAEGVDVRHHVVAEARSYSATAAKSMSSRCARICLDGLVGDGDAEIALRLGEGEPEARHRP